MLPHRSPYFLGLGSIPQKGKNSATSSLPVQNLRRLPEPARGIWGSVSNSIRWKPKPPAFRSPDLVLD